MALPHYDMSQWPLVVIVAPAEGATDAEMREHLDRVAALYVRGTAFAMVVDVSKAPRPPPSQRQLLGDLLADHERRHPGLMVGLAMVVASELQRGIITAVSWIFRPPYPLKLFATRAEASAWALSLLADRP